MTNSVKQHPVTSDKSISTTHHDHSPQFTAHCSPLTQNCLPGLYIHVPFCRSKCPYCDFYSTPALSLIPAWLESLKKEAILYSRSFSLFDSLYLGGGTPSLLSSDQLRDLFSFLRECFTFAAESEITVEANPEDVTREKLIALKECGVNRLSIGAQSFSDDELALLKRRHSAHDAETALERAREAGFTNVGIDLMYLVPGQTETSWLHSLEQALTFEPAHLSCYQMTCEEQTPFGRMQAKGTLMGIEEETQRTFFLLTSRTLQERAYVHYEISNFARSGDLRSRHNSKYWRHVPYLGLGPAAHSYDGAERWWNVRSVKQYCRALDAGRLPQEDSEILSAAQFRLERCYLGMRTREGVAMRDICTSPDAEQVLSTLVTAGYVVLERGRVLPTLEGFLIADRLPLMFPEE